RNQQVSCRIPWLCPLPVGLRKRRNIPATFQLRGRGPKRSCPNGNKRRRGGARTGRSQLRGHTASNRLDRYGRQVPLCGAVRSAEEGDCISRRGAAGRRHGAYQEVFLGPTATALGGTRRGRRGTAGRGVQQI